MDEILRINEGTYLRRKIINWTKIKLSPLKFFYFYFVFSWSISKKSGEGERIELSIDELVCLVSEKRAVALYFNSLVPRIFHISESHW